MNDEMVYFLKVMFFWTTIAGIVDFWFKERKIQIIKMEMRKKGETFIWNKHCPDYLHHNPKHPTAFGLRIGWHIWIISIYVLGIAGTAIFNSDMILLFAMGAFYWEDQTYFNLRWLFYGKWVPKNLPYLHGDIEWVKKLVGENYPRKVFFKIQIGGTVLGIILAFAFYGF